MWTVVACEQGKEERCSLALCKLVTTLSEWTQSIKKIAIDTRARVRALRGDAVNLDDDIEAAKDANRGERRARLLDKHKSLSLALFHFNISSIQTVSLSLSLPGCCWPPQLVANSLQATESRTVIYGQGSRDKSMLSLFFPNSICITSVRCWVSSFTPKKDIRFLHSPCFVLGYAIPIRQRWWIFCWKVK